jgi:raffinose/stachyose/melibiose transport system permease protein
MKETTFTPKATNTVSVNLIDVFALLAGLATLVALFAVSWLEGRNGIYNATQMLLGRFDERRLDYALIFLPFIVGIGATFAAIYALISPRDSRHWKTFYLAFGILGVFYYFNYFVNKGNEIGKTLEAAHTGFWLFLLTSVILFILGILPRARGDFTPSRLTMLMNSNRFWGTLYVLPMLVLLLVFTIYPILESFRMTMYNWKGFGEATQFVGFRHFFTVASDARFWNAFKNTVTYTVILVPVQLTLALILAVILDGPNMKLRTFYRTIYFVPVVTSIAIVAIVMRLMFQSGGVAITSLFVPTFLEKAINPIADVRTALLSVTAFGIWYSFGINLVYFMAALQTVPRELYDAAAVDGANWFQRVRHITLPGIRSVSIIILFFAILGSLRVFEASFVMTGGQFNSEVVSGYIYSYAFGSSGLGGSAVTPNMGYASAAAVFMSVIVLGVTLLQLFVNQVLVRRRA